MPSSARPTAHGPSAIAPTGYVGMQWSAFHAGAFGPGASTSFTISYDVDVTDPTRAITSLQELYIVDTLVGNAQATATERVFDSSGNLITTLTWNSGGNPAALTTLPIAYQHLHVELSITETVTSNAGSLDKVDISVIQQNFGQTATSQLATIGDNVFYDAAGTGIQNDYAGTPDASPGVPGVEVDLFKLVGATYTQVASTTTDADGLYQFIVNPGTYELHFVAPVGFTLSPQHLTPTDLGSTPFQTTGTTGPITVNAGDHLHWIDAGIVPPGGGDQATAEIGDMCGSTRMPTAFRRATSSASPASP